MAEETSRKLQALAACVVGLTTGYPVFIAIAFGLFVAPLSAEFGWSRTEISLAFTICTIAIVILAPLTGALMDRCGTRPILVPAIGIFGLSLAALSLQNGSLWALYALYALAAIAGSATLPPGYSRVVVRWFTDRRGLALSIALSGVGVSAIVLPPALQHLMSTYGWRAAYLALAGICLLVAWPVIAAWLREPAAITAPKPTATPDAAPMDLRDAVLLRVAIASLLLGISVGGVLVHLVPLLTERFQSAERAAYVFSVLGISTLFSRIACGWLLDRLHAARVAMAVFLLSGAGLAWIALGADGGAGYAAALLLGVGFGADFDIISYVVSRYFPLERFSRTYGFVYSSFLIGVGAGSASLGYAYDFAGDYTTAFLALSLLLAGAAILFGTLGPYRQPLVRV